MTIEDYQKVLEETTAEYKKTGLPTFMLQEDHHLEVRDIPFTLPISVWNYLDSFAVSKRGCSVTVLLTELLIHHVLSKPTVMLAFLLKEEKGR